MSFKKSIFSLFLVLFISSYANGGPLKPVRLFVINRSTNANYVCYDANLTDAGVLDAENPVSAYWTMAAKDGHREELTAMEREHAYGFTLKPGNSPFEVNFSTQALPKQLITVTVEKGEAKATTKILGKPAYLQKIFVKAGSGLIPSVKWVKLTGAAVDGGAVVEQKIKPN